MKDKIEIPKENKQDYAHRFVKEVLGAVPFAGNALGELFSAIILPSVEKRRDAWMTEIVTIIKELIDKNDNLFEDLKRNEEFISLLLETSQIALKTHKDERLSILRKRAFCNFSPDRVLLSD